MQLHACLLLFIITTGKETTGHPDVYYLKTAIASLCTPSIMTDRFLAETAVSLSAAVE